MATFTTHLNTKTERTTTITGISHEIVKEFVLDCFLCHKVKLIRNWGMTDDHDHLLYKNTTLLHFANRSRNLQIFIQPVGKKANTITIARHHPRNKPLFDYFLNKLKTLTQS